MSNRLSRAVKVLFEDQVKKHADPVEANTTSPYSVRQAEGDLQQIPMVRIVDELARQHAHAYSRLGTHVRGEQRAFERGRRSAIAEVSKELGILELVEDRSYTIYLRGARS